MKGDARSLDLSLKVIIEKGSFGRHVPKGDIGYSPKLLYTNWISPGYIFLLRQALNWQELGGAQCHQVDCVTSNGPHYDIDHSLGPYITVVSCWFCLNHAPPEGETRSQQNRRKAVKPS